MMYAGATSIFTASPGTAIPGAGSPGGCGRTGPAAIRTAPATGRSGHRRSCTCPMRINIAGSPVDRQRVKKFYKRGLSWPPSGPLTPGDALDAGRVDARRLLRPPPLAASHHPACSPPYWLRPRRHAKQQHLAQRPDVIRQSSGHGGRPRLPALGRARAVGRFGVWQWQP